MRRLIIVLSIAFAAVASALTPRERALVEHALSEQKAAIADRAASDKEKDQAKAEAIAATQTTSEALNSAKLANDKAVTAEKQAEAEHAELVRAAAENEKMRPIVAQVNKWCGIGAFVYGFGKLIHCLLWLVIGIVVLVVGVCILSAFVPWLAPVFTFVKGLGSRVLALLAKLKPKPNSPTPPPTPPPAPPTPPPTPPTP